MLDGKKCANWLGCSCCTAYGTKTVCDQYGTKTVCDQCEEILTAGTAQCRSTWDNNITVWTKINN